MLTLAGCVLLNQDGKILLLHRNTPGRTQWELPGGKIDEAEDPAAAAARELKEELGVKVDIVRPLGGKTFIEDGHQMHYLWFLANIIEGEPAPLEAKFDEVRYFSWDELKVRHDISPNTSNLVTTYFHGADTSSFSKARRIRNERLIKQDNERLKTMAGHILDAEAKTFLPLTFACECSDRACDAAIQATADEYAIAHQYPDHFVIKPGHEQLDIERVVAAHPESDEPEYIIIEKYLIGQKPQT